MTRIVSVIEQTGRGRYPVDIIRLKKGMEGKFSGQIYLLTTSFRDFWGVTLALTLTIEDRAGNSSKPIVFPLEFDSEPMKPLPSDMDKDLNRSIGAIGIELTRPPYGL